MLSKRPQTTLPTKGPIYLTEPRLEDQDIREATASQQLCVYTWKEPTHNLENGEEATWLTWLKPAFHKSCPAGSLTTPTVSPSPQT